MNAQARGRLGGLRTAALHSPLEITAPARSRFESSFAEGHGCRICGPRVEIPADLPEAERERRGQALRKIHATRIGLASGAARRRKVARRTAAGAPT